MSVEDNLLMGAYSRKAGRGELGRDLDRVYATFPKLRERRNQAAATLSGGEQQMCAIGRGLMSAPRLLMIDELSLGLSPLLVEQLVAALRALNAEGMSILLVEQDVIDRARSLPFGLRHGHGPHRAPGRGQELLADPIIRDAYLGVLAGLTRERFTAIEGDSYDRDHRSDNSGYRFMPGVSQYSCGIGALARLRHRARAFLERGSAEAGL